MTLPGCRGQGRWSHRERNTQHLPFITLYHPLQQGLCTSDFPLFPFFIVGEPLGGRSQPPGAEVPEVQPAP